MTGDPVENPWRIEEPPPTSLIVAWPHQEAPAREEILQALADAAGKLDTLGEADLGPDVV